MKPNKQYTNPLDSNSTLNKELGETTAKGGSRMLPKNKAMVFSEKRGLICAPTTASADLQDWIKDWKQLNPNWTEIQISFIGSLLQDLEETIRNQERNRILNLPSMKEEKPDDGCGDEDTWNSGRNNLRLEIKNQLNK